MECNAGTLRDAVERISAVASGHAAPQMALRPGDTDGLLPLVEAVNRLIANFTVLREFSIALANGRLDFDVPPRMHLLDPLKSLQSSLRHLTWQAQEIAGGDYDQRVDFLGDFSSAFNRMVQALREKEQAERDMQHQLENMVAERTSALVASQRKVRSGLINSVGAIAAVVEMRDPYTAGHQHRVAQLAVAIAREMGLPEDRIEGLHLAGLVHDVGKAKIPVDILCKPCRFLGVEIAFIHEHPRAGYDILKVMEFPWPVADIVLQHHERIDGTGYPGRLKGSDVLLEARILAVADVMEAMTSHRPYRPSLGVEAALAEISEKRGLAFDGEVVDACIRLIKGQNFDLAGLPE